MAKYLNEWSNTPGSNNFTQPDGWPEGITSDKINNIGREQMAVLSRWEKDNNGSVLTTGTQPAYVITLNQTSIAAYYDGLRMCVDFHATNASATPPTANVNAIGAKALVWPDGTALTQNEITLGMKADLVYDGTNLQVLSLKGPASLAVHPASSTDNAIARYDSTAGNLQDSGWTIDDSDVLTAGGAVTGGANVVSDVELKDTGETYVDKTNLGATPTFDFSAGHYQSGTVDQEITLAAFSNWPASGTAGSFTLELINGEAFAITWPASVKWAGGTEPTFTASGTDIITFVTRDAGTTIHAMLASLDSK